MGRGVLSPFPPLLGKETKHACLPSSSPLGLRQGRQQAAAVLHPRMPHGCLFLPATTLPATELSGGVNLCRFAQGQRVQRWAERDLSAGYLSQGLPASGAVERGLSTPPPPPYSAADPSSIETMAASMALVPVLPPLCLAAAAARGAAAVGAALIWVGVLPSYTPLYILAWMQHSMGSHKFIYKMYIPSFGPKGATKETNK